VAQKHLPARRSRLCGYLEEKARLADASLTGDKEHAAFAAAGRRQPLVQDRKLTLTPNEGGSGTDRTLGGATLCRHGDVSP
jgi:hypothetical protein